MVNSSIYKLIIVTSTDFFADYLFPNEKEINISTVQQVARDEMVTILDGGDNFYMYADYSKETIDKTKDHFYKRLKEKSVSNSIYNKIKHYHVTIDEARVSDAIRTASMEIIGAAAHLYWLETELLNEQVTDELLDIISIIEPYGISTGECPCDEDDWLSSESEWDQYLMSLMDGIDEAPFTMFRSITTFHSQFDFMKTWSSHLTDEQVTLLKNFILNEAKYQLEKINKEAAAEVEAIMDANW
ncbi:MAG: hypothetical protein V3U75_09990 [Methylococcaceae bacterium]